jgi:hypothetical protein
MNDQERELIAELLRRRLAERTRTEQDARRWLIDEQIYDGDGKLRPQFGGEPAL